MESVPIHRAHALAALFLFVDDAADHSVDLCVVDVRVRRDAPTAGIRAVHVQSCEPQ